MEIVPSTSITNNSLLNFKIVLLGEGAVGKTSLMLRYVENKFNPQHVSTLQASFLNKKLNVDGQTIELNIWDTAGQEKFHALGPIYYRDSHGALLIYDITDIHSFEKARNAMLPSRYTVILILVKMWVKELKRMLGDDVYLMIIGNKVDLERNRNVDINEAVGYAKSIGAEHFETSAKDNTGVTQVFDYLVKDLVERAKHLQLQGTDVTSYYGTSRRNDLLIVDDPPPVKNLVVLASNCQ
ncbi:Ras-related protein Rab-21 [Dirofilaria immitis]|nr:Ras-related protein Rab-21 [Dirofilaria immitis]